jgi:hypothetical protein
VAPSSNINRKMMFVNWREVNALFCALIWMVALVLILVILAHAIGPSTPVRHPPRYLTYGFRR